MTRVNKIRVVYWSFMALAILYGLLTEGFQQSCGSSAGHVTMERIREFESADVETQVKMYRDLRPGRDTSEWMLRQIARQGAPAYDVLIEVLRGRRSDIGLNEAATIMGWMHGWGYDLRQKDVMGILDSIASDPQGRGAIGANFARRMILTKPAGSLQPVMEAMDADYMTERERGIK